MIGQQVQDERMLMTVRKYNPKKKMVPYGESTGVDEHVGACGVKDDYLCFYITCSRKWVNEGMEEQIHHACDGPLTI